MQVHKVDDLATNPGLLTDKIAPLKYKVSGCSVNYNPSFDSDGKFDHLNQLPAPHAVSEGSQSAPSFDSDSEEFVEAAESFSDDHDIMTDD